MASSSTSQDSVAISPAESSSIASRIASKFLPSESELGRWKRVFSEHSKINSQDGVRYLDSQSFIDAVVPEDSSSRIRREQYGVLFNVADSTKRGLVSFEDFVVFETLLKRPDADYQIAFKYFDKDGNGTIDFTEFKEVFSAAIGADAIPFNFDSDWVKLYIGGRHVLGYDEFAQLMKGLQGERLRQAFRFFDKSATGYISPDQFKRIVIEIARHKLSDSLLERLPTLCLLSPGGKISYSEVVAFHNVLREMDLVEKVLREAVAHSKDGKIDAEDFLNTASRSTRYTAFSPLEANLVWHFASRGAGSKTRLAMDDFRALLDERWVSPDVIQAAEDKRHSKQTYTASLGESIYGFVQGGIGGGIGAAVVYPIDLVKTRLQNQRSTVVGEVLYKNWADCVAKVYRNEGGVLGFYRGLVPQLVGVAPEKAIKLTVNEGMRKALRDPETGRIALWAEIASGGLAGGCQVVVTNPLEITKIRLQMHGEMAKSGAAKKGAVQVVKELGLLGLYKGAPACMMRDVPFSMIYFTAYAHMRKDFFGEGRNGKKLTNLETLMAAGISGMPAAYLTTPADVVKTRLQSEARAGQTHYKGLIDALFTIPKEEGVKALFKGGLARVIRSSPQFACTLAAYEWLKIHFPYPYGTEGQLANAAPIRSQAEDLARVRARNGLKILLDVHEDFGLYARQQSQLQYGKK